MSRKKKKNKNVVVFKEHKWNCDIIVNPAAEVLKNKYNDKTVDIVTYVNEDKIFVTDSNWEQDLVIDEILDHSERFSFAVILKYVLINGQMSAYMIEFDNMNRRMDYNYMTSIIKRNPYFWRAMKLFNIIDKRGNIINEVQN